MALDVEMLCSLLACSLGPAAQTPAPGCAPRLSRDARCPVSREKHLPLHWQLRLSHQHAT